MRDLFSYTFAEAFGDCTVFSDCMLKKQIGPYLPGTKFTAITVNLSDGVIILENTNEELEDDDFITMGSYKLLLTVGEEVKTVAL